MNLAAKDIRHNLGRFALTTFGIGMLLMVVMGMGGIFRGIEADATLLVTEVNADLWVVQRKTKGPFAEVSRVPPNLVHRVAVVPGVQSAREFVYHTIQRERHGELIRIAVMGLSWPNDKGDWVPLIAGRPLRQNHFEMIVDQSLGIELGETMQLGKETYTAVGVTKGMLSLTGDGLALFTVADALAIQFDRPAESIRLERAAREARGARSELGTKQPALLEQASKPSQQLPAIAPPQLSAVMIDLGPGSHPQQVIETISSWSDVSVYTQEGQKKLLIKGLVDKVRMQIGLFRILLTIIAAIIMALILYTLTLDKIHSIALLKLIGASNGVILGLILQQALLLGSMGYGIAFLVGRRIFPMFPRRVILTQSDLMQLAVVVFVISCLSSLLGIWKAMKVSPNEALS